MIKMIYPMSFSIVKAKFSAFVERLYGYDIFISYTRRDDPNSAYTLALQATLTQGSLEEKRPPMRCFLDLRDLPHDDELRAAIEAKIRASRHVLFIAGPNAINHEWMCFEADMARKHKRRMIVVDRGIEWPQATGRLRDLVGNVLAISSDAMVLKPGSEVKIIATNIGGARVALRRRRVWTSVVFALCVMLGFAVNWALAASAARERAEKEQRSAEQLVEKMQTDIRFALFSLGRMDLMYDIHIAIEAYLKERTSSSAARSSLRALQEYEEGETFLQLQEKSSAKVHFQKALEHAKQAGWPKMNGWHLRRYGWLLYQIYTVSADETNFNNPVQPLLDEAERVADRILKDDPHSSDGLNLWSAISIEKSSRVPLADRVDYLKKLVGHIRGAKESIPADQKMAEASALMTLAAAQEALIRALHDNGKIADAAALADENADGLESLNMNYSRWEMAVANAWVLAGDMHLSTSGYASAKSSYERALVRLGRLISSEPRNVTALNLQRHCLEQLVRTEEGAGAHADKLNVLRKALEDTESRIISVSPAIDVQ
jgi:hypothetical protein